MSERFDQAAADDGAEPVGSVAEEAAKLMHAFTGWASEQPGAAGAAAASGAAETLAHATRNLNAHLGTGTGADCRYCPICQVVRAVRGTDPEVRAHLAVAASSFASAVSTLLAPPAQPAGQAAGQATSTGANSPLQRIDLDEDGPDRDDTAGGHR